MCAACFSSIAGSQRSKLSFGGFRLFCWSGLAQVFTHSHTHSDAHTLTLAL